jgi:hypothetical protein
MSDKIRHLNVEFRPLAFGDGSIRGIPPSEVYNDYLQNKQSKGKTDYKADLDFKRKRLDLLELET